MMRAGYVGECVPGPELGSFCNGGIWSGFGGRPSLGWRKAGGDGEGVGIPRWGEEDQGSGGREPLPLPTPTLTQNLPLQQLAARGAQQRG